MMTRTKKSLIQKKTDILNQHISEMNSDEKPVVEHLAELRLRLIKCLLAVACGMVFCYYYLDTILVVLTKPVGALIFIGPTEAFFVRLKLSLSCGIMAALPVILYQAWQFINPALFKMEKTYLFPAILFSYLLFIGGVAFAFFLVLPTGMKILLGMGTESIKPLISLDAYISFTTMFLLAFGFIFQLPLIILVLTLLNITTPQTLNKNRKYVILAIFILSAILTPGPDVFSQFMMAIPLWVLFEVSLLLAYIVSSKKNK